MLKKLGNDHWPIFILGSFSSMANLYLPIVLTRLLTPEQMGTYKVFFLYLGALPFLFLTGGPLHSVYYWVGRGKEKGASYIQQSYLLAVLLSSLILLTGFPLIEIIGRFTNLTAEHVGYMLLGGFLAVPADFYSQSKIALGDTIKGSLYDTFYELIKVVTIVYIAWKTKDVSLIFIGFCAVFIFKFITTIVLKTKSGLLKLSPSKSKLKEIATYCLPISLSGLVTFIVDKIDQFALASRLSQEDFAFYAMGCLMIPPLYMLEQSVTKVLVPKLSEDYIKGGKSSLEFFKKAISDNAYLLIPSFFGIWIFSEPIVELLYTSKYLESAPYLRYFAFTYLILILPYDAVPRATGNSSWIFKLTLITGFFSLASVLFVSSYYGALETLAVAMGFKLTSRIVGTLYSMRIMSWSLKQVIPFQKLTVFSLTAIALSIASMISRKEFRSDLNWFLICAPIFAIIYLVLVNNLKPKELK